MRLSKADRHWKYWNKLHRMSQGQFIRHMHTWERFYRVWPRGYTIGEQEGLAFEKIKAIRL